MLGISSSIDVNYEDDKVKKEFKATFTRDCDNIFEQFSQLKRPKRERELKLMRIYVGPSSDSGPMSHIGMFHNALKDLKMLEHGWIIEQLDSATIRKTPSWTHPSFLVDWLMESTIHVILCQGIHNAFLELWRSTECKDQTLRLEFHPGFPMGNNLRCPAFNGDKWGYLIACAKYCVPSFKLLLNASSRTTRINIKEASEFMQKADLGFGFIIKAGFVQNKVGFSMRSLKTFDELEKVIRRLHTNTSTASKLGVRPCDIFDYLILQPRVQNRIGKPPNESKIVLLNGEAQYVCSTSKAGVLGMHTMEQVFEFVELAVKELCLNSHGAYLMDGLSRVDVFSVNGQLRVNEFENLDAQFSKLGGIKGTKELELKLKMYLTGYYTQKIRTLLASL